MKASSSVGTRAIRPAGNSGRPPAVSFYSQ